MSRSFTIVDVKSKHKNVKCQDCLGGRYLSETPNSAVRKAAQKVCQQYDMKKECSMDITIKETTRGGRGKEYKYRVTRRRSDFIVSRGGNEICFKFEMDVKSLNQ